MRWEEVSLRNTYMTVHVCVCVCMHGVFCLYIDHQAAYEPVHMIRSKDSGCVVSGNGATRSCIRRVGEFSVLGRREGGRLALCVCRQIGGVLFVR